MPNVLDKIGGAGRQGALVRKAAPESGELAPVWQEPTFVTCPNCKRRATRKIWAETLYVCRDESYDLLEDLTRKLGIHLKRVKHLPAAERVLRSLDAV